MTRTEDRLTDALGAKAALIAPRPSGPLPEPRVRRRAPAFLAPLGAAAAVVLVAAGAVFLGGAPRPAPLAGAGPAPRYYVQAGTGPTTLQVRSVATGQVTGQLDLPSKADYFAGVAAAPDDHDFYVQVSDGNSRSRQTAIYSFHVTENGKATPLLLVKRGLAAASSGAPGLAVSPDGTRLAVTVDSVPSQDQFHSDTIVVIDLRTGAQRQWRDPRPSIVHGTPMGIGSLSWSDDQTVDFTVTWCQTIWLECGPHTAQVRALDVASSGGSVTASSLVVLDLARYPDTVQLVSDQQGRIVLLEISRFDDFSQRATATVESLSAGNGSRLLVLYRQGVSLRKNFNPAISADPSGQHLLVFIDGSHSGWLDRGVLRRLPGPGMLPPFFAW